MALRTTWAYPHRTIGGLLVSSAYIIVALRVVTWLRSLVTVFDYTLMLSVIIVPLLLACKEFFSVYNLSLWLWLLLRLRSLFSRFVRSRLLFKSFCFRFLCNIRSSGFFYNLGFDFFNFVFSVRQCRWCRATLR